MKRITSELERLQVLAGLESHGLSGRNIHFRSGPRISADAGLSRLHGEYAKPAQFNPIARLQGFLHTVENRVDRLLGPGFTDPCSLDDLIDKIEFDHWEPPRFSVPRVAISFNTSIFTIHEGI